MPLDRSRRSFIADGALTSAIVLAGQAIGWPEAAIAQGVGKGTRSNFTDIQRHENDHVNFLVGALGSSARPKLVALTGWGKTRTATDQMTRALTPMW